MCLLGNFACNDTLHMYMYNTQHVYLMCCNVHTQCVHCALERPLPQIIHEYIILLYIW